MGTRGLTAVMLDGEYRIAQYGQWDHCPGGQGVTALEFCRSIAKDPAKAGRFASNLHACRWVSPEEIKAAYESVGANGEWVTMEQSEAFGKIYPLLSRDHGADILELVAEGRIKPELKNSIDFAGDSLFCEYAYVVDLDAQTFEVYKGFNQTALTSPDAEELLIVAGDAEQSGKPDVARQLRERASNGERFALSKRDTKPDGSVSEYHPVKLLAKFPLGDLPSKAVFLEITERNEDEDE